MSNLIVSLVSLLTLSFVLGVILTIIPKTKHSKYFYDCYLNSWKWKRLRRDTLSNHKGICFYCKKPITDKFNLHHVNADYATLGNELPCDVVPCHIDCHNKEHQRLSARNSLQKLIDNRVLWLKRCYYSLRLVISTVYRFIKPNRKSK
jgi:hypothetical protein